jgi:hypothetical protein
MNQAFMTRALTLAAALALIGSPAAAQRPDQGTVVQSLVVTALDHGPAWRPRAVAERVLVLEPSDEHGEPVAGRRVAVQVNFNFADPGSCSRFAKKRHPSG